MIYFISDEKCLSISGETLPPSEVFSSINRAVKLSAFYRQEIMDKINIELDLFLKHQPEVNSINKTELTWGNKSFEVGRSKNEMRVFHLVKLYQLLDGDYEVYVLNLHSPLSETIQRIITNQHEVPKELV